MDKKEIWADIPNCGGVYQVSSFGNVRAKTRYCTRGHHKKKYLVQGRILKQWENSHGYLRVNIIVDGVKVKAFVHRLVAIAFIKNPNNLDTVNHKDFNPLNNHVENLEWTTRLGNMQYSANAGRFKRTELWAANQKKSLDKIMGKPVVGERISDGSKLYYSALNDCAKDGFQPSCVSCCCNGKRQTHKGYIWKFVEKEEWGN